ncbi:MAG: prolyl-tRNA synthetase associated domain-containing protein [Oscillospiraceae bacterium]
MTKEETFAFLKYKGVEFEAVEHKAVFNMSEIDSIELPHLDWEAKNLFIRDDKKSGYYLISVKGDKRVDLKDFRSKHGLRRLSFASPEELFEIMKLTPGSVTPLGLLEDSECRAKFYLDAEFEGGVIGIHPNDNTATVYLKAEDVMRIIREHGNEAEMTEI